jgi:hypothetical protein
MLFGTFAEQRHFEYPEVGTYQGVIINANMVAHAPAGLAAFLLEKTAGMKYIVDPLTHAFQHDPEVISNNEGAPKSSVRSLAEVYGEPVADKIGFMPLLPKHFEPKGVLHGFTERCLRFQQEHLKEYMAQSDAAKYLQDEAATPPYAVVAPYFYLTETNYENWLEVCQRAAATARSILGSAQSSRLFASVVVSQGAVLDPDVRKRITRTFVDLDVDGYLLWVDNLDEQSASGPELRGLLNMARALRQGGTREVINVHGGYFSILASGVLGDSAFSGVTHGPEFGEFRGVVPVGGGIPIAKYYIPKLHARVRYRDALRLIRAKGWLNNADEFHANVCSCLECTDTIAGNSENFSLFGEGTVKSVRRRNGIVRIEYPTGETKLRCLRHYLQRKRLEYKTAGEGRAKELLGELEQGIEQFEEVAGMEGVSHLRLWSNILGGAK